MSNEQKPRTWKRVLTLSTQPKPGITTIANKRTFCMDVCVDKEGRPFFLINNDFGSLEPKDIARLVRHIVDKKTFNNVFVHEACAFKPYVKDEEAAEKSKKPKAKKTVADVDESFDEEDVDSEESDEDDFDV
jgi:hypothetical protein